MNQAELFGRDFGQIPWTSLCVIKGQESNCPSLIADLLDITILDKGSINSIITSIL